MKNFFKNNCIMLIFVITSLINSFITIKVTVGFGNFRFIFSELTILLIISSFSYLIKRKSLYFFIWSIILVSICSINSIYYTRFGDFTSIYQFETLFQAIDLPSEAITNEIELIDFIYFFQIIIMLIILNVNRKKYEKNPKNFLKTIIISICLTTGILLSCSYNDIYKISNDWNKGYIVHNFGIYNYQLKDTRASLTKLLCNDCGKEKAEKIVNDYYKNRKVNKNDNEFTNIYKDKNVLLIHAESIQSLFVNASINGNKIMPNLSKMTNEGIYFTNYYSQEGVGTSSDTESILNNSILPVAIGTTFLNYEYNNYESIPKMLNRQNYYTFSMHGNTCEYWNRSNMYKSFDYDHYYCYDQYDLTDKIGLGLSDKSFFNQSADMLKEIDETYDKFYGKLITLTNHSPFYTEGKIEFDSGYMEGTMLGNYLKLSHYVDEAIGEFINKLDELKLLDDTIIIIYGDHDAKLKKNDLEQYINHNKKTKQILNKDDPNYNYLDFYEYENLTKVPLLIWSKNDNISLTVDEIIGTIDILPTLGNMLGFESNYALGNDIFNVEDNMVVFPNGNWRTNDIYYNSQKDEYRKYNDKNYSFEYLKNKEIDARKIVEISNYLVRYDLVK